MRVAIQGERGSNSHAAVIAVMRDRGVADFELVPCGLSAEVFEAVESGAVDMAVLPIENSLHGSVAEHYDFLLTHDVAVRGEWLLRVRHNVIAAPGVKLVDIREVMSHPVALSQCRNWLRAHGEITAVPFYDTAGSVKRLMQAGRRDVAGVAPVLAAEEYGAEVLVAGIEDHAENYTRFLIFERGEAGEVEDADKLSVGFSVEHRPGTLLVALECFRSANVNLTKIESRPVPGRPWEYVFFVDVRYDDRAAVEAAMSGLRGCCQMVKELGRYRGARVGSLETA